MFNVLQVNPCFEANRPCHWIIQIQAEKMTERQTYRASIGEQKGKKCCAEKQTSCQQAVRVDAHIFMFVILSPCHLQRLRCHSMVPGCRVTQCLCDDAQLVDQDDIKLIQTHTDKIGQESEQIWRQYCCFTFLLMHVSALFWSKRRLNSYVD